MAGYGVLTIAVFQWFLDELSPPIRKARSTGCNSLLREPATNTNPSGISTPF